ncbi:hypothetical protein BCY91_13980 [Pelobium manganitolerans]|uniref:HTH cro/C1-type domain-containing protein n=1 Tax=Pelobium manganitolerans TaxID=1842495 RepID=A0A419SAE0_9SPHI|nr:hypothetical protein [Pelobium manganitolerans]RKD18981.1 hypothetical protein BCY91_13980 [Pelobium manganitolerans]
MKVDARELVFIRDNAPKNFAALISDTTGVPRSTVNNELSRIKRSYNEEVIKEARRLLKVIKGIAYEAGSQG